MDLSSRLPWRVLSYGSVHAETVMAMSCCLYRMQKVKKLLFLEFLGAAHGLLPQQGVLGPMKPAQKQGAQCGGTDLFQGTSMFPNGHGQMPSVNVPGSTSLPGWVPVAKDRHHGVVDFLDRVILGCQLRQGKSYRLCKFPLQVKPIGPVVDPVISASDTLVAWKHPQWGGGPNRKIKFS